MRSLESFRKPSDALDGDARVIGDFLLGAREDVEERSFAGVGVAEHRHKAARRININGSAMSVGLALHLMQEASARRSAKVETPMRTAIGSPPSAAMHHLAGLALREADFLQPVSPPGTPSAFTATTSSGS